MRLQEAGRTREMHPEGCEVVICTEGEMTLVQEGLGTRHKKR